MPSTTIASVIAQLLVIVLPMLGIQVGSDALTGTIQTIVLIGTGLWIWKERFARGDVRLFAVEFP